MHRHKQAKKRYELHTAHCDNINPSVDIHFLFHELPADGSIDQDMRWHILF
jgi:hypothetical protein